MMIFKKVIPRRTFLTGLGATLSLPLLDAMVPAFATAVKSPLRLGIVHIPNGAIMEKWTPAAEGAAYEITPTLEPLAAFRDCFIVLTGLSQIQGDALPSEGQGGPHERAGATFLTCAHAKRTDGADIFVGVSVDQIAAKELGKHTQLASLELGMDQFGIGSACEQGWSCAYLNALSWRTSTTPLPMEANPRTVFERLFGDSQTTNGAEQRARNRKTHSLLDSVSQAINDLQSGLGPADRSKLNEYVEAVRDIERRIQLAEEQSSRELPELERPPGIPATFQEHVKLMFDLQVMAYQCDLTRMITFSMGREKTDRTYREIGIPDAHHPLTHHQNDAGMIAKVAQINLFHVKMLAYFLEKLRSTPDGDGSLLDHLLMVYGGSLSDGNAHSHHNLPILLMGGDRIKGGRHIKYPLDTPMANLYLNLLDKVGVRLESFGDSTGKLKLLSV